MSKKIIVTEKPSVAREFAKALNVTDNYDGYMENDEWIITWCVGHLIEMAYPEDYDPNLKKWDVTYLPFIPKKYLYHPIENVMKQFQIIKGLYNRPDINMIYYAGDPAREGIYIQMLVRQEAGHTPNVKERVVWIDSQTEEEILNGIRTAKELSEYKNLINSGYMRAIEDYLFGINFTRLLTIKYGNFLSRACNEEHKGSLAVGRVMTCVLGMIVKREREIEDFSVTKFYKIKSEIGKDNVSLPAYWKVTDQSAYKNSLKLYNETGFKEKSDAADFIKKLSPIAKIIKKSKECIKKNAPLLFNLAELQSECSKRFKISPDQTLTIVQTLYEKKLTTYPRTDARVLSSAIAKEIKNNLYGIADVPELTDDIQKIDVMTIDGITHTKYVNDAKVSDHYALIPTGYTDSLNELSELEKDVYLLIARRFIAIFFPPAIYEKVNVIEQIDAEQFFSTATVLTDPGYMSVTGIPEQKKETTLIKKAIEMIQEGTEYPVTFEIEEGKTAPPKRYTSGSIILAMENAGNLIEDEELREQIKNSGIGTSATRAATIEKLINGKYIKLNKKTQILTPDTYGNMVYEAVALVLPDLLSPKMTASWEKGLDKIVTGEVSFLTYKKKLEQYIESKITTLKTNDRTDEVIQNITPFAKNKDFAKEPIKKEKITGMFIPKQEEISFAKVWGGHTFTEEECQKLLAGEEISFEAKTKNGNIVTVSGSLAEQEYNKHEYWGFKLKEKECPPDKYEGKYKGKKVVRFKKIWGGHTFTEEECQKLLAGEEISFEAKKRDGNIVTVSGSLAEQEYNKHKYWGFKLKEKECPPDKYEGKYKGKKVVRFKKIWGGHTFTEEECQKLLAGEEISFEATTKNGNTQQVKGVLKKQTYQGHSFWGFSLNTRKR
ncbi:DNA topoisomerase-3 [Lachnospiraceae bacterium KHCPX20]|nr:DNA topoisomerase-3 [Lachnospiraceae bacterium KHCPX20]